MNSVLFSGTLFMQSFMKRNWLFTRLLLDHLRKGKHAF